MYTPEAVARRRCRGTRRDGQPCRAWALWGAPGQRCVVHAEGARPPGGGWPPEDPPTMAEPCRCAAYAWPHRPGGGLCRWPGPPVGRTAMPAGTRAPGPRRAWRRSGWLGLARQGFRLHYRRLRAF
jgi:hypothetical protein